MMSTSRQIARHSLSTVLRSRVLELGEGLLDRVEVGAVRRKVEDASAGGLDQRLHLRPLMAGEVVHHDDGAVLELRGQDPADTGLEGVAIDRPVEYPGRDDAPGAEVGHEGRGLPTAVRYGMRSRSPRRHRPWVCDTFVLAQVSSMKTSRSGSRSVCVEIGLSAEPGLPALQDVGALLFGGMGGLF